MVQGNGPGGSGGIRGNRHRLLGPRRNDAAPAAPARPAAPANPTNPRNQTNPPQRVPASTFPQNPRTATPNPSARPSKVRVLFVCIGNSCRSQMAEGFAKAYGADIIAARSAGLSPANIVQPLTKQVLAEHNVRIDDHFPKALDIAMREPADLIVNMSGHPLQLPGAKIIDWRVQDPIGMNESVYRTVATQIEALVMRLILDLRNTPTSAHPR